MVVEHFLLFLNLSQRQECATAFTDIMCVGL